MKMEEAARCVREAFREGSAEREALEAGIYEILIHADASWGNKELSKRIAARVIGDVKG